MKRFKLDNPFIEYGYFGPEYFCDREEETDMLMDALLNGSNVTLMAPRRVGKTGLIHHTFERMKARHREIQCFYVDIFPTKTFEQMVQFVANVVMGKLDTPTQAMKRRLSTFVAALRPTMTPDPVTGMPTFSVTVEPDTARQTLMQVFEYIKASGQPCFLALDEFQQVSRYSELGADAFIRSIIQQVPNLHIIFSGSQQHLLADMFMSPQHPFFNSSQIMSIKEIDAAKYLAFANGFFAKQKRQMDAQAFNCLYELVDGQTWYVQKILNRLYRKAVGPLDEATIGEVVNSIIAEQEITYQSAYNLLTDNQARLLTAVACEHTVKAPTSHEFVRKYRLPAPSSIKVALQALSEKETLYHDAQRGYLVYDRFFAIWLRRLR